MWFLNRNVPGVAVYFTGLNYIRTVLATSPYFISTWSNEQAANKHGSTLPKLSSQGNLLAGATARVTVGVLLNPFTILKARYEVWLTGPFRDPNPDFLLPLEQSVQLYESISSSHSSAAWWSISAATRGCSICASRCAVRGFVRGVLRAHQTRHG